MKELEKPLKALANRRRLAIVKYLKQNHQASVGELAGAIKLSFKSTSKHLAVLSAADIVDKEQKSLTVFYRISSAPPSVAKRILDIL
jgi:DNA-binding transcriptional ArsR family regulator